MRNSFLIAITIFCLNSVIAQNNPKAVTPNYTLAQRFTASKLNNMLFSTYVDAHWLQKGNSFWYQYKTGDGNHWYMVNPDKKSKKELFNRDTLASQLTRIVKDPFDAKHLPLQKLRSKKDGNTFTFEIYSSLKDTLYFSYDYSKQKITQLKNKTKIPKNLNWASISPDGKTVVYAKDCNLFKMSRKDYKKAQINEKDSSIVDIQLTKKGQKDFGFGIPYSLLNTDTLKNGKRRAVYGLWSPDSKHFAININDNRKVKDLWVINSMAEPRPTLETYKYQMPGEKESPVAYLYLFDMNNNSYKEIKTTKFKDQTISLAGRPRLNKERDVLEKTGNIWAGSNNRFYVTRSSRDLHRIDICSYDLGNDSIVPIIKERLNTYQELRPLAVINNGKELIEWSERDGWAHLYLYDNKGNLEKQLTHGAFHVHKILKVDEAKKVVYFTTMGFDKNENPYYQDLCKVSLNGGKVTKLTKDNFFHLINVDDDCHFFVNSFSRVNTIPKTILCNSNGRKVMDLEKSDFSQMLAAGYKFPEPFKVKADDGITDLYGVMYKPFDFDSTKVYPIIDYVYPGPQVEATNYPFTRMALRTDRLAQAGFIVITVGNRGGHPNRSKWYHNYGYGNLRDYGLADQKAAITQLADKYKFIDINKVGIHGHSGGGFMSTAAILQYPDFFKVAVSCAGNHDNRIYNRWWSETHNGVKEKVSKKGDTTFVYNIHTNPEIAHRLKGHILLVHGDIDNNVHPANTIRVVNALIRANKRFDMLILPQQRHGFGNMNEYFYWRLVDYFSKYLLGSSDESVNIPAR